VLELRHSTCNLPSWLCSALGEDVEDERVRSTTCTPSAFSRFALLDRGQARVEDRKRRALLFQRTPDLLDFFPTREVRRVGPVAAPRITPERGFPRWLRAARLFEAFA